MAVAHLSSPLLVPYLIAEASFSGLLARASVRLPTWACTEAEVSQGASSVISTSTCPRKPPGMTLLCAVNTVGSSLVNFPATLHQASTP